MSPVPKQHRRLAGSLTTTSSPCLCRPWLSFIELIQGRFFIKQSASYLRGNSPWLAAILLEVY